MQYSFTFTLSSDEYVEFIRWQALQAKYFRGLRMFINVSLITLIICTVIFFNLYKSWMWMCVMIAAGVLWLMYGAPYIFHRILNRRIQNDTLTKMGITGFQVTTIKFDTYGLHYQTQGKQLLPYQKILKIIPLHNVFVIIGHAHETILLPYSVFADSNHMQSFLKDFEKQCNG